MKSMTGMGKATGTVQGAPVRVEVKSVNHRFCEVHFRAHGKYNVLEILVQNLVKSIITRGRVDIFIADEKTPELNMAEKEAYKAYFDYLTNIKQTLKIEEEINLQHLLPGVNSWIQKEMDPTEAWKDFEPVIKACLDDLNKMRSSEGERLKKNIKERFESIDKLRGKVEKACQGVQAELEAKIHQKISEKIDQHKELDPQRLQTKVVFYLDRMDITEELERLKSHMGHAQEFLSLKEPIGRKIDFLLQEFNREFNTIASKSQSADIAHLVVDAKAELEKIREQIQNIE